MTCIEGYNHRNLNGTNQKPMRTRLGLYAPFPEIALVPSFELFSGHRVQLQPWLGIASNVDSERVQRKDYMCTPALLGEYGYGV